MRFLPSFLDEIRDRVPISSVIGRRVTWDKRKTNTGRGDWWACCPFHGEKSPSFHCEDRKGRYHCFGCGVSGDHFRFLTELEGLSFPEAVQQLADMAGVAMPVADPAAEKREAERATLIDVMEMAAAFFQDQLQTAIGARARAYLRDRGLSGRTIETFRLGYAPDSRNALKEHLAGKGIALQQMEACGLLVHGPDIAVSYDRFRDRVMFPILNARERVIAFGGRALSPDQPAKYLNSNETELFHKGNVLYNFTRARRAAQGREGAGTVIAVEGYMDVIALHQAGVENAVAPLGTALTENQLELLWRMTPEPILCFDGDQAGIKAANRAVDLALPGIRAGRTVRFALLPDGKDPDDLVKEAGRAPFDQVIAAARPLADMVWSREAGSGVFETPERRAELEGRLKQVVAQIGDESVRRHYGQEMRDRLNAFFGAPVYGAGRGGARGARGSGEGARGYRREDGSLRGQPGDGRPGGAARPGGSPARMPISDRLSRSQLVRGPGEIPALREAVLALTLINHPFLLVEEFDEVASLEMDHRDLARLLTAILGAAADGLAPGLEKLRATLDAQGFSGLIESLDRQIRNARIWTATTEAAGEDARDGFLQALALHKRARALRWQKAELERDIAEAIQAANGDAVPDLLRALAEVQLEEARLQNQEAIIDGFGVMSGRGKGPGS